MMANVEITFFKDKNTDDNIKEFLNLIHRAGAEVDYLKDKRGDECYVFEVKELEKRSPGRPVKKFTELEFAVLIALLEKNATTEEIAKQMKKSKKAVEYNKSFLKKSPK